MAPQVGKAMIAFGVILIALGAALWRFGAVPMLWRLPGDILVRRGNFTLYFPITTAIVISVVLSLLLALLRR